MGVHSDAKYFLSVFPGQKAQITDCQVRTQITFAFTQEHTFRHPLYKSLLITYYVPGAGNSAAGKADPAPVFPAFVPAPQTQTCPQGLGWVPTDTLQRGPAHVCAHSLRPRGASVPRERCSEFCSLPFAAVTTATPLPQTRRLMVGLSPSNVTRKAASRSTPQFSSPSGKGQTSRFPQVTSGS